MRHIAHWKSVKLVDKSEEEEDGKTTKTCQGRWKTVRRLRRGDVVVVVLPAVLAECVFVVESFYEHPCVNIVSALGALISSPCVEINEAAIHLDALDRYRKTKVHFVDCLIAATASAENTPVSTFDSGLSKIRRRARRKPIVFPASSPPAILVGT